MMYYKLYVFMNLHSLDFNFLVILDVLLDEAHVSRAADGSACYGDLGGIATLSAPS